MIIKSQRAMRAFLLLIVIQIHCEILLAEKGRKHNSTFDLIPEKDTWKNVYDDDLLLEEYPDDDEYTVESEQLHRRAQHLDSDSPVTKVKPARRSRSSNSGYAARRSQSLNSGYLANLRQLHRRAQDLDYYSPVTKVPTRRSQSLNSNKYAAALRQLLNDGEQNYYSQNMNSPENQMPVEGPNTYNENLGGSNGQQFSQGGYVADLRQLHRRAQPLDSDSSVTNVPARRSLSSKSGLAAALRQLLNNGEQNLYSHENQISTKRPKYTNSEYIDDSEESQQHSDSFEKFSYKKQLQRDRKILPKHKSDSSDHEHSDDLSQSSETAPDQVASRKSEAARRSAKASLRTFPDSKQQPNARRTLLPAIRLAKLGLDGIAHVLVGESGTVRDYEEVRTVGCPTGTHFVIDHCEPIVYIQHNTGPKIKKIVRTSDVYLDDDEFKFEI